MKVWRRCAGAPLRVRLAACALAAAAPMAFAQQISLRQYTQADGLLNMSVRQMLVDPSGDVWIATDNGLFRYNGVSFQAYDRSRGIPMAAVTGIARSPGGRVIARLDDGIYLGGAEGFVPVRTGTGSIQTDQYSGLAAPADDRILFVHGKQLYEATPEGRVPGQWQVHPAFSATRIALHPELTDVKGLTVADSGAVWFGCGTRICAWSDGGIDVWGESRGVIPGEYTTLLYTPGGRLWARGTDHVVVREPGARQFLPRDPPEVTLSSRSDRPMMVVDGTGRVITRTRTGLARWQGSQWETFSIADGLPHHAIIAAAADREGNFWLGGAGVGVFRWLGYDNLESWTRAQGLGQDAVWSIGRDRRHRLILGTEMGCELLDEAARRAAPCPFQGLPQQQAIAAVMGRDGSFWFSYSNGQLWRVPADRARAERFTGLPDHVIVNMMVFDQQGDAWLAARDFGLARIHAGTLAVERIVPPGGPRVDDVTWVNGEVWMATTAGLFRYRDGRFTAVPALIDGSPVGVDTVEVRPNGEVWAARIGEGLLRVAPDSKRAEWVHPEAFDHVGIYSLCADRRGWIWANTDQGVGVYDGNTWRLIGVDDGLVWNDTEEGAFFPDDDGSVWIGTSNGLAHIRDPQAWLAAAARPLELHVAAATLGSAHLADSAGTELPWRSNAALDVSFASRTFSRSPHTQLRYRLLGLSSDWYATSTFGVHVPALAPGAYVLEAVAVDPRQARSSATVRRAFTVIPPWWRSNAFVALVVLAVAGLAATLLVWRARRVERAQRRVEHELREREALLERATHDALTGLWNRATILESLDGEIERARITSLPLAVALLDVDHFKQVNDSFGHDGGDGVLQVLARRLQESLRARDSIGRYGGEELLIVMPGLPEEDRGAVMDAIRESICSVPIAVGGHDIRITVSIGVAWLESASEQAADLIRRADAGLYRAKAAGRNQVVCVTGEIIATVLETTASRRYLKELIERVRRDAGRQGADSPAASARDPR